MYTCVYILIRNPSYIAFANSEWVTKTISCNTTVMCCQKFNHACHSKPALKMVL